MSTIKPEIESKIKEWINDHPRTELTLIKEIHTRRMRYALILLISVMLTSAFLYNKECEREFTESLQTSHQEYQKIIRKETIMQKVFDKKSRKWEYEIIKESYK